MSFIVFAQVSSLMFRFPDHYYVCVFSDLLRRLRRVVEMFSVVQTIFLRDIHEADITVAIAWSNKRLLIGDCNVLASV